jgi:molybdenum cofactor cytidylyltransferase
MTHDHLHQRKVAAVVLAAGRSRRMGTDKLFLPWGSSTVVEKIITSLQQAGITKIVVVSGGSNERLKHVLEPYAVEIQFNPDFENGEMVDSIKKGISVLPDDFDAVLIVLGDQPQMEPEVVKAILHRFQSTLCPLIVPSYQLRRGHPWLIGRIFWNEILELQRGQSLRTFLERHSKEIEYQNVETASILMDLDTPEDYATYAPKPKLL